MPSESVAAELNCTVKFVVPFDGVAAAAERLGGQTARHLLQKPRRGDRIGLEESEQLIGNFGHASRGRVDKIALQIATCPRESIRAGVQAISPQVRTPAKIRRDHSSFDQIEIEIAEAVDRMKTSAGDVPVVVVGGGSILLGDTLPGASELVKPDHFAVANAIGAAIAQIGGEVDRVFSLEQIPREEALERARAEATEKAVAAGASPGTVHIVDVEEVPLAYLPSNATRIHVKAVGELELGREIVAPGR